MIYTDGTEKSVGCTVLGHVDADTYRSALARISELEEKVRELRKRDAEAAHYVESVICMRTHFTGQPPYVGWKGLGLALSEALDERDDLKRRT